MKRNLTTFGRRAILLPTLLAFQFFHSPIWAQEVAATQARFARFDGKLRQSESKIDLSRALDRIKEKYGISIFYNPEDVRQRTTDAEILRGSLEEVLERVLTPHQLRFEFVDKKLVVVKKALQPSTPKTDDKNQRGSMGILSTMDLPRTNVPAPRLVIKEERPISGIVRDGETGDPMPGVSIAVRNSTLGTVTDNDGRYFLRVPDDATILVFSFVGYEPMEVTIGGKSVLNINLKNNNKVLNEVVVIGYGEQQKKDLTGSVSSIKGNDLKSLPLVGVDQMMQGKASGVTVTSNSGQPGGGVSVRIRGITSLTGSNEPLYVVDGVPFNGDGVRSQEFSAFGGGGGQSNQSILATLNPSDILTIDILKDASATAIYGSRASNGVILITTKKGKLNESKISYDGYFGVSDVTRRLPTMNLREFAAYQNQINAENGRMPVEEFNDISLLGNGTDWQREIFQSAPMMSHQLSISGGGDRTRYYISGGFLQQDGIVLGSDFNRYTVRANIDNQAKDWLKVGVNFTASRTQQRITLNDDENGVVSSALLQAPNIPVKYPNGAWGGPEDITSGFPVNPVALALIKDVTNTQNRFMGNFYADFSLRKNLVFRSSFGGDVTFAQNRAFNPTYEWGKVVNTLNKFIRGDNENYFWILQNYLTYNPYLGDKHRLTLMGGHEAQRSKWEWLSGTRTNFLTNDVPALNAGTAQTASNENGRGAQSLQSFYARAIYTFADRYSLTFTQRADGSSKFGSENKWGLFPSAALAWTLTNEKFLKNNKVISNLKLRLGYGAVGNQNIINYAYGVALKPVITAYGTGLFGDKIANAGVKWESANQFNLGLDVALLKDRVSFSVDFYDKISSDFLYQKPLPKYTGVGSNWDDIQAPFVNLGKMQNKGVDLTLNTTNVERGGFSWKTSLILSHYTNKILELVDNNTAITRNVQWFNTVTKTAVGQPVGLFYGFVTDGIFQSEEEVRAAPAQADKIGKPNGTWAGDVRFKNIDQTANNGKQVIDGLDRAYIGSPHPDFTFGFTNSFSFKGFDLSIFLQGAYGAEIFNFTRRYTEGMNNLGQNQMLAVNNRWTTENKSTDVPRAILGDPNGNNRISDRFIEDGSFMRIQNISLGYVFNNPMNGKAKISRLRVYATVQNLKTFTNYTGFDPELGAYNQDALLMNVDNGHYPVPRTITAGINVEF